MTIGWNDVNDPDSSSASKRDTPRAGWKTGASGVVRALALTIMIVAFLGAASHAAPCPDSVRLDIDGSSVDLDAGGTGIAHDLQPWPGLTVTMDVSGCAGTMQGSCGQCSLSGPIGNAGGAQFDNRRCTDATWIRCDDDGDCPGLTGPCRFFFGPPYAISTGGVSSCVTTQFNGSITGTINPDSGATTFTLPADYRVYNGIFTSQPCPKCVAGICDGGDRDNQPCTTNATHPLFGNTSFDCPPLSGAIIAEGFVQTPTLSTTTQTRTISAASPSCTAFGFTGFKCPCDTCNNADATPCASNADCTAVGATICGGFRCLHGPGHGSPCTVEGSNMNAVCGLASPGACTGTCNGSNVCVGGTHPGTLCFDDLDCQGCTSGPNLGADCFDYNDCGGYCGRPGEATQSTPCGGSGNCVDASVPGSPPFGQAPDEGVCQTSPNDTMCSVETFRGCLSNNDCRPGSEGGTCIDCAPGMQTCQTKRRECFFDADEIGASTHTVTATASASPPVGNTATVSLGSLFCMKPTGASVVNSVAGFPGLGRFKIGAATFTFADEIVDGVGGMGTTVTTDSEADGATSADPVETTVTSPNAGSIEITEGSITGTPPGSFQFVGQQVSINAPPATAGNPLILVFLIDSSVGAPLNVAIFRNGVQVPACAGAGATPDPCVASRQIVGGDVEITVRTSSASDWNFGFEPVPSLCGSGPTGGCLEPVESQKASVLLKDDADDGKDKLIWKWIKGDATAKALYGNPTGTTNYELCVYDGNGLVSNAQIPGGGDCDGKPCWQEKPTSFKYKDKFGTAGGITKILLKEGLTPGKAKIILKGKGEGLAMPNLGALASPLTIQLVNGFGDCWGATYSFPPVLKNDGVTFKDKAD